jgi:Leucine Rich Repeat (LRR) protein
MLIGGMETPQMATATPVAAKPKRRWLQFQLRTLLVFTVLCGIAARWVGDPIIKVRRQAKAVEAIRASGGYCYDCQGVQMVPAWLQSLLGRNREMSVSHAVFPKDSGDAEMALLDDLPNLFDLMRCGSGVTDAGLEHVKGLTNLRSLNLSHTQITDGGLQCLARLTNLQELYLQDTRITAAGLKHVKGLTNLETLDVSHTQITDAGLQHLKDLKRLDHLWINGTEISDAGLEYLNGLSKLEILGWSQTRITNEGADKLKQSLPNCALFRHEIRRW